MADDRGASAAPVHKSCACVVDARDRLLVFFHPADGNLQLPKGTVEPGEAPHDAVRRELLEESGIVFGGPLEAIGTLDRRCPAGIEGNAHEHDQLWHLYLMRMPAPLPETFEHIASGSPEEDGLVFAFRWLGPHDPLDGFILPYRQVIERVRAAVANGDRQNAGAPAVSAP